MCSISLPLPSSAPPLSLYHSVFYTWLMTIAHVLFIVHFGQNTVSSDTS